MAKTTFKDAELRSVIAEMTEQLESAWQTSKQELLAKADPEESDGGGKSAPPADPSSSDSSAPASDPAASAPAEAPMGAPASAAPASAPASADPAMGADQGGAPLTPEALQAEYSQLAPEELDMHIKAALAAKEALAASASAVAPDAASAAAPGNAPAGAPPMAMKAEIGGHETSEQSYAEDTVDKGEGSMIGGEHTSEASLAEDTVDKAELIASHKKASGGQIVKKTEAAVDPREAEIVELKKSLKTASEDIENLTKAVKMVLERPERKAITTIAALSKHEAPVQVKKEFSPVEARDVLNALVPKLTKSEREIMFDFYAGKVKVDSLAPIFEAHNVSPKK